MQITPAAVRSCGAERPGHQQTRPVRLFELRQHVLCRRASSVSASKLQQPWPGLSSSVRGRPESGQRLQQPRCAIPYHVRRRTRRAASPVRRCETRIASARQRRLSARPWRPWSVPEVQRRYFHSSAAPGSYGDVRNYCQLIGQVADHPFVVRSCSSAPSAVGLQPSSCGLLRPLASAVDR